MLNSICLDDVAFAITRFFFTMTGSLVLSTKISKRKNLFGEPKWKRSVARKNGKLERHPQIIGRYRYQKWWALENVSLYRVILLMSSPVEIHQLSLA